MKRVGQIPAGIAKRAVAVLLEEAGPNVGGFAVRLRAVVIATVRESLVMLTPRWHMFTRLPGLSCCRCDAGAK